MNDSYCYDLRYTLKRFSVYLKLKFREAEKFFLDKFDLYHLKRFLLYFIALSVSWLFYDELFNNCNLNVRMESDYSLKT